MRAGPLTATIYLGGRKWLLTECSSTCKAHTAAASQDPHRCPFTLPSLQYLLQSGFLYFAGHASFPSLCPGLISPHWTAPWVTSSTPGFSPKSQSFTLPWAPDLAWTSVSHLKLGSSPSSHLLFLLRLYFSKHLHHLQFIVSLRDSPGFSSLVPRIPPARVSVNCIS